MIVGVYGFRLPVRTDLYPGYLCAAVGDYLVGIHIGRGSRTRLVDINGELIIELALIDLPCGLLDEGSFIRRDMAQLAVDTRSSPFDQAKSMHDT